MSAIPFLTGDRSSRRRPLKGAPNILFVLYDDTGLAAWSAYGGRDQHADAATSWRPTA
ncbi:MAG: hypothetical protein MZW92_10560 [Comamonadaceae bacterium]|nr:hypothetical protein [Comamonadaceae bacterium]